METVSFLLATCDEPYISALKNDLGRVTSKWESLFPHVKQYQYAGQMLRMKRDFLKSLNNLQTWLRSAEVLLDSSLPESVDAARIYNEDLQVRIHCFSQLI